MRYSLIGHEGDILAEYSDGPSNFHMYGSQILANLPHDAEGKKSYPFQEYLFHTMASGGIVYIVVAINTYGVRIPYAFLEDLKVTWMSKYGSNVPVGSANDEFSRILRQKMEFYSNPEASKLGAINKQIEHVKTILVDNMEKTIERGENIQNLVQKSESLTTTSATFKTKTTVMKKKFCRRNVRCWIGITICSLIILAGIAFGIYAAICYAPQTSYLCRGTALGYLSPPTSSGVVPTRPNSTRPG